MHTRSRKHSRACQKRSKRSEIGQSGSRNSVRQPTWRSCQHPPGAHLFRTLQTLLQPFCHAFWQPDSRFLLAFKLLKGSLRNGVILSQAHCCVVLNESGRGVHESNQVKRWQDLRCAAHKVVATTLANKTACILLSCDGFSVCFGSDLPVSLPTYVH